MVVRVELMGLKLYVIEGIECMVIVVVGEKWEYMKEFLVIGVGVLLVVLIFVFYKVVSFEVKLDFMIV